MNRTRILIAFGTIALAFLYFGPSAQAQQKCPAPPGLMASPLPNIFTPQQEVDLGDVEGEQIERKGRVIHDDELTAYLNRVTARLLAQLPPTDLRFRVILVDEPAVDSYSLPGGRIYVSRKMVAFVRSEDELAGLLGHEMGHILTHQLATDMTRMFREVIGVTSVGDRKDVFLKFNQFLDNAARNPKSFEEMSRREEPEQYQADQMALYAAANAGYSPESFVGFFDRLAQTQGKTGDFFSNLFGTTKPDEKRLRLMRKALADLPDVCRTIAATAPSADFQQWQADVIGYSGLGQPESLIGVLDKKVLDPPLRSDLDHLKFSPDGKFVLAQDDASIFVLARDPLQLLFRLDALDAHAAQFTPDSQSLVFDTRGLRVEKWSISDGKRVEVHEMAIPKGCLQTRLSPDGKALACLNGDFDISLFDVAKGTTLLEKKAFLAPEGFYAVTVYLEIFFARLTGRTDLNLAELQFSPDARYFLAANPSAHLAFDLSSNSPVSLHGSFGDMLKGQFAFLAPDRVIAVNVFDSKNSAVIEFPSGKILEREFLGSQELEAPGHGNYAILRPVKDAPVGLLDLSSHDLPVIVKKSPAMDAYDDEFLGEKLSGEVALWDVKTRQPKTQATLSLSLLGPLLAASVSQDLQWVALSGETRGGVWNLWTGKRLYFTRGFRGAYFEGESSLLADFPRLEPTSRSVAILDLRNHQITEGSPIDDKSAARQYGQFIVYRTPNGKGGSDYRNVILDIRDVHDGHSLWTRTFPKEVPDMTLDPRAGTLLVGWQVEEDAAKDEIKKAPALQTRLAEIRDRKNAYVLEAFDARTGNPLGSMIVDTGKGSFRIENAYAAAGWVVIADTEGRTRVYSLSTGTLKGELFGIQSILSTAAGLLAVENEPGKIDVYDLASLEKRSQLTFRSPIALWQFSGDGTRFLVLTKAQTAYTFDSKRLTNSGGTAQVSTNSAN
jgi:WD40 repeat protein